MAHGSGERANGTSQLLLSYDISQQQITVMPGAVRVLPPSMEYSHRPSNGLTVLWSSRDLFKFGISRAYL